MFGYVLIAACAFGLVRLWVMHNKLVAEVDKLKEHLVP